VRIPISSSFSSCLSLFFFLFFFSLSVLPSDINRPIYLSELHMMRMGEEMENTEEEQVGHVTSPSRLRPIEGVRPVNITERREGRQFLPHPHRTQPPSLPTCTSYTSRDSIWASDTRMLCISRLQERLPGDRPAAVSMRLSEVKSSY
jgi:hypothetical protein